MLHELVHEFYVYSTHTDKWHVYHTDLSKHVNSWPIIWMPLIVRDSHERKYLQGSHLLHGDKIEVYSMVDFNYSKHIYDYAVVTGLTTRKEAAKNTQCISNSLLQSKLSNLGWDSGYFSKIREGLLNNELPSSSKNKS